MKKLVLLFGFLALTMSTVVAQAAELSLAERANSEVHTTVEATAVVVPTREESKASNERRGSGKESKTAASMNCHDRADGAIICS